MYDNFERAEGRGGPRDAVDILLRPLACERGQIELTAGGERWTLTPGDVLAFRGDQRHGYANAGEGDAVGYSVLILAPG